MPPSPSLRVAPVNIVNLGGTGNYGVVIPSGAMPGDALIIQTTDSLSTPSGWAELQNPAGGFTYFKTATGSDPGSTITLANFPAIGFLLDYQNAGSTTPLVSAGTTGVAPAITTTVANSTVVHLWAVSEVPGAFTLTIPTVAQGQYAGSSTAIGGNAKAGVSDVTQATAGLAATKTATVTGSVTQWVGVSIVVFPVAVPDAPLLGPPVDTSWAFLAGTPTFDWTPQPTSGDGAQSAYAFRRKLTGAYSYWNATTSAWSATIVWNVSAVSSLTFPPGAWVDPNAYSWSVATEEATYSLQSAFATDFVVNGQAAPVVTVTAPTATIFVPTLTVTWTYTTSAGTIGTSFRVIIYNAAQYSVGGFTPGVGPSVFDSGNTAPFATSYSLPVGELPDDSYRAYVSMVETNDVPSAWAFSPFVVNVEDPATPDLLATGLNDSLTGAPEVKLDLSAHDNLLTAVDASGETGVGSWLAGTNTTLSRVSSPADDGSFSFKLTATAGGAVSAQTGIQSLGGLMQPVTITTAFLAATTPRSCTAIIYWFKDAGGTVPSTIRASDTSAPVTAPTTAPWGVASLTATPPSDAVTYKRGVGGAALGASEVIYFDENGVAPGTVPEWSIGGLAGTTTATILRSDGVYVRHASPDDPLTIPWPSQRVTIYDDEPPPGEAVTYTAVVSSQVSPGVSVESMPSAPTSPVTVTTRNHWYILDPLDPSGAVEFDLLTDWKPKIHEESTRYYPIGRPFGVKSSNGTKGIDGSMEATTTSIEAWEGLQLLMQNSETLLLQGPSGQWYISLEGDRIGDALLSTLGRTDFSQIKTLFPYTAAPRP